MKQVKQVIVMRKDLNMRKGKMCAQAAHASLGLFLKYKWRFLFSYWFPGTPAYIWLRHKFRKIVVSVDSKDALLNKLHMVEYINENKNRNIPYVAIKDAGDTEFHGVPTWTCIAIGPWWSEEIDWITGDLKLL